MDIEEGVNNEQFATASGVVEAATTESVSQPVATDESINAEAAGVPQADVAPAQGAEENGPVPYDRFKEVNEAKKIASDRVAELENYIKLTQQPVQQPVQQPTKESLTLQVMKELGIDPENILTGAEQAQVNDEVSRRTAASYQAQASVQSYIASKPDFAKVVGAVDPLTGQFMYSPPLTRVIQSNPSIATALQSAGNNAAILAYELASKDPVYMAEVAEANKPPAQKLSEQANQTIQQANSQTSVSAVAGVGSLDKAAAIRAMSDEEFKAYKQNIVSKA